MNQVYKIFTFVFLAATIVLSIALIFSSSGNRVLKRENKELQEQIEVSQKRIQEGDVVIDGLKTQLKYWNKIINININENDINGLNAELDSNIEFLAKFLDRADSLEGQKPDINNPQ